MSGPRPPHGSRVVLQGVGLHGGREATLCLSRVPGATSFRVGGRAVGARALRIVRADFGVLVALGEGDGAATIDLVEHLCAALGALGLHAGVECEVTGGELPLLDGGAARFFDALTELDVPPSAPRLTVQRSATLDVGESRYEFEPAPSVELAVDVEFRGFGRQEAEWDGSRARFRAEIAPARTFGYASDAIDLQRAGRAGAGAVDGLAVLADDGRVLRGAPLAPSELARHKLLDLAGDMFLFGGPPRGKVRAFRPGHSRTHEALRIALREGIVRP